MSIKIYDGMRIRNADINEVKNKLLSLKSYYQKNMLESIKMYLSKEYYKYVDNVFNSENKNIPYEMVNNYLKQECEKIKNDEKSIMLNREFTIQIKQFNKDVYLYSFQQEECQKEYLMKNIPEIEEYGYWDNADKPDDISESHWNKRKLNWDKVYTGYTFSESGFEKLELVDMKELIDKDFSYDWLLPISDKKRIKEAIKNLYIGSAYYQIIKGLPKEDISHSMYMTAVDQYIFFKNEDLEEEIEKYISKNLRIVDKDNFFTIEPLSKIKFKTKIIIKEY